MGTKKPWKEMQTKKVIEQENDIPVIVDHTNSEGNRIFVGSIVGGAYIENSKATEVAKAICPKYQEVEDDRDILQYTLSRVRKFVGAKPGESIEDKFTELKDQNAKVLEALKNTIDHILNRAMKIDIEAIIELIHEAETK